MFCELINFSNRKNILRTTKINDESKLSNQGKIDLMTGIGTNNNQVCFEYFHKIPFHKKQTVHEFPAQLFPKFQIYNYKNI